MLSEADAGGTGFDFEGDPAKLLLPVDPMPGEGLPELVLRATASNFYHSTAMVLKLGGLSAKFPAGISNRTVGREAEFAAFLGLSGGAEALRHIRQTQVPGSVCQTFFGTSMRAVHRHVHRRRVSPRGLSKTLHCRAVWSLRVLGFCPDTLEELIDSCPVCRKPLSWTTTKGIAYCSACGNEDEEGYWEDLTDLRDHPQRLIEVDDMEALSFVTGLIDPDPDVRANFRPNLHEDLRSASRGDLWEFATALAFAASALHGDGKIREAAQRTLHALPPNAIADAGRALLAWPHGFHELAGRLRATGGICGTAEHSRREAEVLIALRNDRHLAPALSQLVKNTLIWETSGSGGTGDRSPESSLPLTGAARQFGFSASFLSKAIAEGLLPCQIPLGVATAPILISERDMSALVDRRDKSVHPAVAARLVGIPQLALPSLFERRFLQQVAWISESIPMGRVAEESLAALANKLLSAALADKPPRSVVPLRTVAQALGAPHVNPWASICSAILKDGKRVWKGNDSVSPFSALVTRLDEFHDIAPVPWEREVYAFALSRNDASHLLATNDNAIYTLMRQALLPRQLGLRHLQTFSDRFVLTSFVRTSLLSFGICLSDLETACWLRQLGLQPISASAVRYHVWVRRDVEKALETVRPTCLVGFPARGHC